MKELSKEPDWISEAGQCERPGLTFDPLFHVFVLSFLPFANSFLSFDLSVASGSCSSLSYSSHSYSIDFTLFLVPLPSSPAHSRLGEYLGEINFESHWSLSPSRSWLVNWCKEKTIFDNRWNYIRCICVIDGEEGKKRTIFWKQSFSKVFFNFIQESNKLRCIFFLIVEIIRKKKNLNK